MGRSQILSGIIKLQDQSSDIHDLLTIEHPKIIERNFPNFILDISSQAPPTVFQKLQDIHGSYLINRKYVTLFGPNILVDEHGLLSCESRAFKQQFLDNFGSPTYQTIFPGAKPKISIKEEVIELDFNGLVSQDTILIEEPVFLATPLEPNNWGRWISTVISKAEQYKKYGTGRKFLCHAAAAWQREFLDFLGIKANQRMGHDPGRVYHCADLMTVDYSVTNITVSDFEREIYLRMAKRCTDSHGKSMSKKLFVSRRSQNSKNPKYRVLQNENSLIDKMVGLGFEIIEPELMKISDQIVKFGSADYIVALGGAALYNSVFADKSARVVTIESSNFFLSPHTNLLSSCGLRHGVIIGKQDHQDSVPVHKRWHVDADMTVSVIKAFGHL